MASGGVLVSRHLVLNDAVAFRPVLNLMYREADYRAVTNIPEHLRDPDVPSSTPTMWTRMSVESIDIPVGFELPVTVSEKLTLSPVVSFAYSLPLAVDVDQFSCEGCAFAIEAYETGSPMRFWAGVRLQPKLTLPRGGAQ